MFYALSKLLWIAAEPANFLLLVACLGLALSYLSWQKTGRLLVGFSLAWFLIIAIFPVGQIAVATLENRFPAWIDNGTEIDGIVVLGGTIDSPSFYEHRGSGFNSAVGRITEAATVARKYPKAKVIFAGGTAKPMPDGTTEATIAHDLFNELGIDDSRLFFDIESMNTSENAWYAKQVAQPKTGERWLLITSAFHMPRAIGCFRLMDFPVIPYPVDYHSFKDIRQFDFDMMSGLKLVSLAVHEATGLAAYRWTGRISEFFPRP